MNINTQNVQKQSVVIVENQIAKRYKCQTNRKIQLKYLLCNFYIEKNYLQKQIKSVFRFDNQDKKETHWIQLRWHL